MATPRRLAAVILVILVVGSVGVAPAAARSSDTTATAGDSNLQPNDTPPGPNVTDDNRTGKRNYWHQQGGQATAQTVGIVTAVVETTNVTPERLAELRNRTQAVELVYQDTVQVRTYRSTFGELRNLSWVRSVRRAARASPSAVSEGVSAVNADRLHELGVTGENVTVGVIDLGFNISNPEIADSIAGKKAFAGSMTGSNPDHGTAVAEIVLDVAPDATIFVATISTAVEFARAVDWLESNGVDVITTSVAWPRFGRGGTFSASQAATEAANNGTVFLASAGNEADSKARWEGDFVDTDADRWADFTRDGFEANYIANGATITGYIDIRLSWAGWPTTHQDYDLYLYDDESNVIARSTADQSSSGGEPFERISGTLTVADTYYIAVKAYDAPSRPVFELTTGGTWLYYNNSRGSITPPATGVNVIGVGAYQYDKTTVESFSSRGPTLDGRGGINVAGPDGVSTSVYGTEGFDGTSAAAPHVAGVAALLKSDNGSFTRSDLVATIEASADDIHTEGFDYKSGQGQVNAKAALRAANPHLDGFTINRTSPVVGQPVAIDVSVDNTPAEQDTETVRLYVDGNEANSKTVSVGGQSSVTVTFEHVFTEQGTHTVSADYLSSQSITVLEPANVTVVDYDLSPSAPDVNETVLVTATVANTGDVNGTITVRFYADGSAFANETVTLEANETTTVSAATSFATNGTHTVTVGNGTPTSVTVGGAGFSEPIRPSYSGPPTDPDGDGRYEDVNGNGGIDIGDVQALFANQNSDVVQNHVDAFDFNGNDEIDIGDVQALFVVS